MDNLDDVYPMILEAFQRGFTEEETFERVCRERNLNSLSSTVNWLDRIHTSKFEQALVNLRHKLVCTIAGQYLKFRNAIFNQGNWNQDYFEMMLNGRTLFAIHNDLSSFALIDTFNGESRNLQIESELPEMIQTFGGVWLSYDRVVIGATRNAVCLVYLLKFDVYSLKYSILADFICDFAFDEILQDSEDNATLMLYDTANCSMIKMKLLDDPIRAEPPQQSRFDSQLVNCKLGGDRLFAFQVDQDENDEDIWSFMEYNIIENPVQTVNEWPNVRCPICPSTISHDNSAYVWTKNKLFVSCDSWSEIAFTIVVFDAESLTWAKTNFTGIGDVKSMELDEDYVLTVNSIESKDNNQREKTTYRLPMRKPDKLQYLTWSAIRRGSMFFGSNTFEKFFPRLPYNSEFRSFAEY